MAMNRSNIAGLLFAFTGVVGLTQLAVAQGALLSNGFAGFTGVSFLLVGWLMWFRDA